MSVSLIRHAHRLAWKSGLVLLLSLPVHEAQASSFSVNPVQIYLSAKTTSTLLTLRNDSAEPLRFQLSLFSWEQTSQEQMQLQPSQDIIFFPPLLTLGPKEERKIRIGAATPFGATEKAYRVFVEELPPVDKPGEQPTGVKVLTKMGIPIFLEPSRPAAEAVLEQVGLQNGKLSFSLRNSGTSHFVAEKIFVRGFGDGGDVVFDRQLNGWYVLAGRTHAYEIAIPEADCARLTTTAVEIQIGRAVLKERLQAACAP